MAKNRKQQPHDSRGIRVAVVMTCHNRVSSTVRCIETLKAQKIAGLQMRLYLVDDGSNDGTAKAVSEIFLGATILRGDGSLFWCGGMHWAFSVAMQGGYDFYLWLNDDIYLEESALARLLDTHSSATRQLGSSAIVVGSLLDPDTNVVSYGGWRQILGKLYSKSWEKITPDMKCWVQCDTINGNCVLIPQAVVQQIGNLDPVFRHSMGDMDYGFRVRKNGFQIVVAPGYCGTCRSNDGAGLWTDGSLPLVSRWRKLLGPKGLPVREWRVFAYRYKGPLWMLFWLSPYIKFWVEAFTSASRTAR